MLKVRKADHADADEVLALYKRVAAIPGGIARLGPEVDIAYVNRFLERAITDGVVLVIESDGHIVAEIHSYRPGLESFSHVLSELTIVVDPNAQGMGLGRRLFAAFLAIVQDDCKHISRVELIARESNRRAIRLYESLGFVTEGVLAARIRNADGSLDADIPMAWLRENQKEATSPR